VPNANPYLYARLNPAQIVDPTGSIEWEQGFPPPMTEKNLNTSWRIASDFAKERFGGVILTTFEHEGSESWNRLLKRGEAYDGRLDDLHVSFVIGGVFFAHAMGGDKIQVNSRRLQKDFKNNPIAAEWQLGSALIHEVAHNMQKFGSEPLNFGPTSTEAAMVASFEAEFGAGTHEVDEVKNITGAGQGNRRKEPYGYFIEGKIFSTDPAAKKWIQLSLEYSQSEKLARAYGTPYTAPTFDWNNAKWALDDDKGKYAKPPAADLKATQW